MATPSSLVFTVEGKDPEVIFPAVPTPHEFKPLSDIDDQKGLRVQVGLIQFYRNREEMQGRDPVKVIKDAIAKALVFYYPLAGRLREGPNEKLIMECNGEGVMFIEANADVRLDQFGDYPQPPFPGADDLLYNVPGSDDILNCPLLLIQVTRLTCGGFIFALRRNHTIADQTGLLQFMKAVGEIARGADHPSVQPVWERELLNARDPPKVSCQHYAYHELEHTKDSPYMPLDQLTVRTFFFSVQDIARLKKHLLSTHLQTCSKFEILTASLWQCRTTALNLDPNDEVRLAFPVNIRAKMNPPLPDGYYGNATAGLTARSTSGQLCQSPIEYAIELIKGAKDDVTDEFTRSSADYIVQNGRPRFAFNVQTFYVSDQSRIGSKDVDFGWGKALYSGPMGCGRPISCYIVGKNNKGEDGTFVEVGLPGPAMMRFAMDIEKMLTSSK